MEPSISAADVTVAVLNYNGRELLPVVLGSLGAQTISGFRVHVLDDASHDDSLAYLAEHWPHTRVLPSAQNRGITAGMARAVDTCTTPFLALLNNDLELDPGWLSAMCAALAAHPEAACVDGKMLRYRERGVIDGAGDEISPECYPRRRGEGEADRGQYDEACEVFSATGGAALFRCSAFAEVGNFDVDFGAYYEDVDWGFRARLAGYTVRYEPGAISYHMGSTTTGREPGPFAPLIVRNQVTLTLKNMPGPLLARGAPRLLFFQIKWLAFDALHGLGRAHLRGLAGALRELPRTLGKRRAIQRRRRAGAAALARAFSRPA